MKKLLLILLAFTLVSAYAQRTGGGLTIRRTAPTDDTATFDKFDLNQFGTNNSKIVIKDGATLTNAVLAGAPNITDLSSASHNHQDANGGGTLDGAAIATGTVADARIPAGVTRDTEWDTAAEINAATTDDDFATLTGTQTLSGKTLTTPIIGSFTNANHTHQSVDQGGSLDAAAIGSGTIAPARLGTGASATTFLKGDSTFGNVPYTLTLWGPSGSPADSATYYIGTDPGASVGTTYSAASVYIPRSGTLKKAWVRVRISAVGSTENVELYLRHNDTTDITLSTTFQFNLSTQDNNYDLDHAVTAGDTIAFKVVTPAWATNPTSVRYYILLYIE